MDQMRYNATAAQRLERVARMHRPDTGPARNTPANPAQRDASAYFDTKMASDALAGTSDVLFRIPVFLSYATPFNAPQAEFLARVIEEIKQNLLFPRTLGRSDQNTETPLTAIRRMMNSSFGLIAIAFRRAFIPEAVSRPGSPREQTFTNFWLSSPYLQIEPSMAYQQGLPIALYVEEGVSMNGVFGGILEQGAAPFTIITFSLASQQAIDDFFNSVFWVETFLEWVGDVRSCYKLRTQPEDNCGC